MAIVPRCLALVLCDSVERRGPRSEPSIVRVFEDFHFPTFPATTERFAVWMQLADGSGAASMELFVEYLPPTSLEIERVLSIRFGLEFRDPNETVEHVAFLANGIGLNQPGRYRIRLVANGTTIGQRSFMALRAT